MMVTMKKRRKISSAAALREEEGAAPRDQESGRSHRSRAVWEQEARLAQAVGPASAADCPLAPQPADLELGALPAARAELPSARALPRLVAQPRVPLLVWALRSVAPDQLRVPLEAQRRRRQKARLDPPVQERAKRVSPPAPAKQVARDPGVGRRPGRQVLGRAEPERQRAGNRPPAVGALPGPKGAPSRVDAAGGARRPSQKAVPAGNPFFDPCAAPKARLL